MSTITTRAGKGSPLTNNEVDANFTNLNTDKAELSGASFTGSIDVTGTATMDGLTVSGAQNSKVAYFDDSSEAGHRQLQFTSSNNGQYWDINSQGTSGGLGGVLTLSTRGSQRLTIDTAGNVGIGTSPSAKLHVDNGSGSALFVGLANSIYSRGNEHIWQSLSNTSEYMRISAGNLLVGKTNTTFSVTGIENRADGRLTSTRSGNTNLVLNRLSSDGSLIDLYKDGTTVGSIGSTAGNLWVAGAANGIRLAASTFNATDSSGTVATDTVSLGYSNGRWKDLYLSGTVNLTGGKISSYAADASAPYFADAGNVGIRLSQAGVDDIVPCSTTGADRDNAINLGSSGARFKDLYLSGTATVGVNGTEYANNYLRFKPTGAAYIDHNTVGQAINFRLSNASSLDKTVMTLTSAGNVGIGGIITTGTAGTTTANSGDIVLQNNRALRGYNSLNNSALKLIERTNFNDIAIGDNQNNSSENINLYTSAVERMRISSAGHTTFGTTNLTPADSAVNGTSILSDGRINHNAQSQPAAVIGRTGTDGTIIDLRKSGTTVGSIGTSTGGLYIADAGVGFRFDSGGTDDIIPCNATGGAADASINLGSSGARFKDLYLSGTYHINSGGTGKIQGTNAASYFPIIASGTSGSASIYLNGATRSGFAGHLQLAGTNTVFFNETLSQERMRIDSAGNVGIGTSAPVNNTNRTTLGLQGAWGGQLDIMVGSTVHAQFGTDNFSSGQSCRIQSQDGILFKAGGAVERMRISSAGNVGIGTASAPSRLTVTSPDNTLTTNIAQFESQNGAAGFKFGYQRIEQIGATVPITFVTGGSESMRIDSAGNLTVGDSSTAGPSNSACTIAAGGAITTSRAATNNQTHHSFVNPNGVVGTIKTIASQTSFNTSSDQRLKENIADADDAGSKIDAIQVRQYDWKVDGSHQDYGMIAQELQAVAPEAVSVPEDSEEMMGVDYSKLVPMLIKEIQSLRNRVAQLEE